MNPRDCVWMKSSQEFTKTILHEKDDNFLHHDNSVHKSIPMPQAIKIPAAKEAVDYEWGKL